MGTVQINALPEPVILQFPGMAAMSVEDFHQFCGANRDLRIERTAVGDIIVTPRIF